MGITISPNLAFAKPHHYKTPRTLGEVAVEGKYYRHPDSARISYPLVTEKPLGSINKPINVAIIGGGAAALAALYELSNVKDSEKNIRVTLYESDPDHFVHVPPTYVVRTAGLKAGRVSAAVSSDVPVPENVDHAVYEIGAMRFPEIAGLMWHYASILYGADTVVDLFPNPGTVATELLHGDHVDRFATDDWLNKESPTKKVVELIKNGLVGQSQGENTSLFPINGQDPAKISAKLKDGKTTDEELKKIDEQWKVFANKYNNVTLVSAVTQVITARLSQLPAVPGLRDDIQKINYYVELFGTVGFGTGGFKSVFNMSILETMRLLLWDYSNEYMLPVTANVAFLSKFYEKSLEKNPNVRVELARVCDVTHLDQNPNGSTLVVFYRINADGTEMPEPQKEVYDYVILATTPRQTSSMIGRIGFNNTCARKVPLGDHGRRLSPDAYEGSVRPALVLSQKHETANSKLFSAVSNVHMVCCSKIFASVKKADFDKYAPEFSDKGKVKAIVADCGLGSSYVVPSTILNEKMKISSKDYYSFLISYAWEDDSKKLQHNFGKYPMNIQDTEQVINAIVNRTTRFVKDPVDNTYKPWWFGEALSKCKLEDVLSYDWTTFNSAGAFKLDNAGDHYNSHLLFCYNNHALKPALKNKFFLANCSYSHLGGWLEGAFMSAVNAVCGLIVAANDGDKNALSAEARKVVDTLETVAENID
ncbi:hypothetical protein HA402_007835 [Bradysia odoriphaga]|nr:hypothetical protein HA402_007835 [Bradysia odoriphaga]